MGTIPFSQALDAPPWSDGAFVIEGLRKRGFEAYFVGGCVRDALLKRPVKDVDITTAATPDEVEAIFPKTIAVGKSFGVVVVVTPSGANIEVATFRSDGAYIDGRRPTSVHFGSAEQDVERRDFTINALMFDGAKVIDYVGGLADIEAKVLRAVGDARGRLSEDRLRVLRALRFAAQLGFAIEPSTWQAINETALTGLSAERIMDEFFKAMRGPHRGRWLELLEQSGHLGEVCPPLDDASVRSALDALPPATSPHVAAAVCLSRSDFASAQAWLEAQPCSSALKNQILWLLDQARKRDGLMKLPVSSRRRLCRHGQAAELALMLSAIAPQAAETTAFANWLKDEQARPPERWLLSANDLLALGFPQGPLIGRVLRALEDAQLEGRFANRDQAVAMAQDLRAKSS